MDTTAETLVGTADDDQVLLALTLDGLGLGALEDGVGGLAVLAGLGHGPLGAGDLGGGDNLHGLGDLLDVANRLETALNFTEGGIAGGIGDSKGGGTIYTNSSQHLTQLAMQLIRQWGVAGREKSCGLRWERTGRRRRPCPP